MYTKTIVRLMVAVLFPCLFFNADICFGTDTISANESLSGYQTIVSAGGAFVLGFFRPGESSNYYIGMWYNLVTPQTIVWVANREKPVTFYSELRISNGNLVLLDESNNRIWSTNVNSTKSASLEAVLLDNGNLVLREESSSSEPLWQSFDHPTDTFLPGGKMGYNKITKTSQILTSWKNMEDPAPGLFSLELDPSDDSFNLLWNKSTKLWSSGSWNGDIFSLVPEMRRNNIYEFNFVLNDNESYFTYSVLNSSSISRFVMDVSGQIEQLSWLPMKGWNLSWSQSQQRCDVYAYCGAFAICNDGSSPLCSCLRGFEPNMKSNWDLGNYSGGCIRKTELQCEKDKFLAMSSITLPGNQRLVQSLSPVECEASCLSNCSCMAYAYDGSGCKFSLGRLLNLKQKSTNDEGSIIYLRLAASEVQNHKLRKFYIFLFGIISVASITLFAGFSIYYLRRKKLVNKRGKMTRIQEDQVVSLYESEKHIRDFLHSGPFREDERRRIEVPFVVLESILAATDNFSEANRLGQGGFGPVYKGQFSGGQEIAIKRLSRSSGQGLEEFKNEVLLIAKLQHRNLVRLLGYCVEGEEKMLLYEYMPNKSLDSFLFNQNLSTSLSWDVRFNIIMGIARGLHYLHHDSRLRIIHRDLKTSNVLLDEEMNPKISDFGLARIFGGKQMEANTSRVVGTYGYMSPEYALDGLFSIKSDVFSFGVVILEIISGKRNTGFYQSEEALSLLGYAWKLWKKNKVFDLMDAALSETCSANEFLRCVSVGLLCVQEDPSDRPTMSNAVFMLGSQTGSIPNPEKPAFVVRRSPSSRASSADKPLSKNELTDTLNEGR